MRHTLILTAFALLGATAGSAAGQTVNTRDASGARASLKAGYGGHGSDWEASIDSPLLGFVRLRAGAGRGRWASPFDSSPPAADDPTVTRLAGILLIVMRPPSVSPSLRAHAGLGVAAFVPHGVNMTVQRGTRVVLGMEHVGQSWAVGPEFEFDFPHRTDGRRSALGHDLLPAARIGIAVRRRF